jgi:predicted ferric reductase
MDRLGGGVAVRLTGVKLIAHGFLWLFFYIVMAIAPLVVATTGGGEGGRGFWTELSVALGFVGLAILGLQFAVTARSNGVDTPYGLDVVLQFHREISFVGLAFVLVHPLILFVTGAAPWALLQVLDAPWRARFGVIAVVALLLLVGTSIWRTALRLNYEVWRVAHGILAAAVMIAGLAHVVAVGYYVSGLVHRVVWSIMSLCVVGLIIWVRVIKPVLILRRPWRVREVVERAPGVHSLILEAEGHDGMRFQPGQFAWLTIGRSPLRITEHPFSLSSSADAQRRVELTIKELGDFTATVPHLEPGTAAFLDGPYGVFTYERNEAAGFVFVAGGIGITPILSMLRTLADRGDRRPLLLLYANEAAEDIAFRDELDGLQEALELDVIHVLAEPPEGWDGESGLVTPELLEAHLPAHPERREHFLCGPAVMMDAVTDALLEHGVPLERIHSERFDFI